MKHTVLAYVVIFWVLGLRFQEELAKTQGIPNCFCPKTQFRVRHVACRYMPWQAVTAPLGQEYTRKQHMATKYRATDAPQKECTPPVRALVFFGHLPAYQNRESQISRGAVPARVLSGYE
jgi:hypothetical protein